MSPGTVTALAAPPKVVVAPVSSVAERRALLRTLAARVLEMSDDAVAIAHRPGSPPRLVAPSGTGLYLSSASRDGLAVVATATCPVGIDVERVIPDGDLPWNVLHPAERKALGDLPLADRASAFARLWSCKEAYLKAVGVGLHRDPRRFAVRFADDCLARIHDEGASREAVTRWTEYSGSRFAVSTVILPDGVITGTKDRKD